MNTDGIGLYKRTCAICGKEFECSSPAQYVYKRSKSTKRKEAVRYFCSWTCFRKDEKQKGA